MIHHCLAGWFALHSVPELVSWWWEPDCQEEEEFQEYMGSRNLLQAKSWCPWAKEKLHLQLWLQHRSSQKSLCSSYFGEGLQPSCEWCWGCGHCSPCPGSPFGRGGRAGSLLFLHRSWIFPAQWPAFYRALLGFSRRLWKERYHQGVFQYGQDQDHFLGFLNLLRYFEDCWANSSVSWVSLKYFYSSFILFTHRFKDLGYSSCTAWDWHINNCYLKGRTMHIG